MQIDLNDLKITISKINYFDDFINSVETQSNLLFNLTDLVDSDDSDLSKETRLNAEYLKQISLKLDNIYENIINELTNYINKLTENEDIIVNSLNETNSELDEINRIISSIE